MKLKFLKILSSLLLTIAVFHANAQDPNFHIYLCFGQSNMNGAADFEAQDTFVNPRFKVLQAINCDKPERTKANWYTAVPPLCHCNSGLSPADYFGRTMVENLPKEIKVGIINIAIPGCDIRLFDKDIYAEYYKTHEGAWYMNRIKSYDMNPYQYLIDLAKIAQKDGVIKGILLHQGETNAGQQEWPSYVKKIYNDMLNDLSLNAKSVPLLAGEMVSAEENCCAQMNPIINTLPNTIPTAFIISSEGCSAQDKAHFDADGYREMGRRYAQKMLSIQQPSKKKLDAYGGWPDKKLTKTGYFHTEYDGNRWWFVTPEGNAFLSWGINHYHAGWWIQAYNKEYWVKKFGAKKPRDKKWNDGFREAAANDLNRLGINTLGWHTDAQMLTDKPNKAVVPYLRSFKPLKLDHYTCPKEEDFMDVFSPEFEQRCDETAKRDVAPYANDPMLLGYCMSDCPPFTENDVNFWCAETTWSRSIRNLGDKAPGKQIYVAAMKKRYNKVAAFNQTYATNFSSWDELSRTKNWRPNQPAANKNELADNETTMLLCVDKYYEVSKAAIRKYDKNHLFLGDKLNGNSDNLEKVLNVAAKYVDVIVYQFYGSLEEQNVLLDKLIPKVDLPFVNGDIGFTVCYEMMPNPHGPHAKDQAQRAAWLEESVMACFARPEFIGWHMCGIIDTWKSMPTKEKAQHQGIMTVTGEFYPEMEQIIRKISDEMFQVANSR